MYFASRMQAGRMLATQLVKKYRGKNCAVIALDDGGVTVGIEIANQIPCVIMQLVTAQISLPREPDAIAGITANGVFSYNHEYSQGEIDELVGEYHGLIEQEKLTSMHELNRSIGKGSIIDASLISGRTIIVVSDGMKTGFSLDMIAAFLKTIAIEKLIVVTPLASVQAVDHMHIVADEIYCLTVVEDYISTDHYYDQQDAPEHEKAVALVEQSVRQWQQAKH